MVDIIDKYGIGYINQIIDLVESDKTDDFQKEAIIMVFDETLYEYNIPKSVFFGSDDCPNKKYARIVIVNVLRDFIGSVSLSDIALLLRLNSTNHVSIIYRESLQLNAKIKNDNFALNLIFILSEKVKKLKDTKDKIQKSKAKQLSTITSQFQTNN